MESLTFIVLMLVSVLFFSSCTKTNYSWNDVLNDVNLLKDNNYTVYLENSKENQGRANKEFLSWGLNITTTNVIGCFKDSTNVVYFEEFESEKQAKELYEYQISNLGKDRSIKLCLKGNIVISSNYDEAIKLLGYNFE